MKNINLKKTFLVGLIVSLSISALFGIYVFIFGTFSEIEEKILTTSLLLGAFSLTGLCAGIWFDRKKYLPLSYLGMISSLAGFVYCILLVWSLIEINDFNDKFSWTIAILAVSAAHASLLLLAYNRRKAINRVIIATLCSSSILTLILIGVVIYGYDPPTPVLKIMGVFSILTSLGSIVIPLLLKVLILEKR